MRAFVRASSVVPLLAALAACTDAPSPSGAKPRPGDIDLAFASAHAVLVDFELDGELTSPSSAPATQRAQIAAQLTYTIGQLNGDSSVGRMERLEITSLVSTPNAAGTYDVTYHAKLPVAWGKPSAVPATYTVKVPRVATAAGLDAWVGTYNTTCVGFDGSGADRYSFWYYYRPATAGCVLSPTDTVSAVATVTKSPENTVGKYPEYDKVWSDGQLRVVAMYGRNESGATANSDPGIADYNSFVAQVRSYVRSVQPDLSKITETPGLTNTPGAAMPQVSIAATLPLVGSEASARRIQVDVMLVGYRIYQDGATFDAWYDPLTPTADIVLYAGHAGLGENVHTLMNKGVIGPGQYTIWMVNGCDTFAYVDPTLADRVSAANGGAASTLYLDTVSNAMPSYFGRTPGGSMRMIQSLMAVTAPRSYPEIFSGIDPKQIVVVTGEEDNTYDKSKPAVPGVPIGVPDAGAPDAGGKDAGGGAKDAGGGATDAAAPSDAGAGASSSGSSGASSGGASSGGASSGGGGDDAGCACTSAPGHAAGGAGSALLAVALATSLVAARQRRRREAAGDVHSRE